MIDYRIHPYVSVDFRLFRLVRYAYFHYSYACQIKTILAPMPNARYVWYELSSMINTIFTISTILILFIIIKYYFIRIITVASIVVVMAGHTFGQIIRNTTCVNTNIMRRSLCSYRLPQPEQNIRGRRVHGAWAPDSPENSIDSSSPPPYHVRSASVISRFYIVVQFKQIDDNKL